MMALDLSMKSTRRGTPSPRPPTSPGPGPRTPTPPQEEPLPLVTKKRVRFQDGGAVRKHHPYGVKVSWRRLAVLQQQQVVVDSDEENRPPSTASSDDSATSCGTSASSASTISSSSSGMEIDSRLSSPDSPQMALHPASMMGHVTVPVSSCEEHIFNRLPSDPRDWSRDDVAVWLHYMKAIHHLSELQPERFLMNGKALCLMNANMFSYRVPLGGKLLYRDFRTRLSLALARQAAVQTASSTATPSTTTSASVHTVTSVESVTSGPPMAPPARA